MSVEITESPQVPWNGVPLSGGEFGEWSCSGADCTSPGFYAVAPSYWIGGFAGGFAGRLGTFGESRGGAGEPTGGAASRSPNPKPSSTPRPPRACPSGPTRQYGLAGGSTGFLGVLGISLNINVGISLPTPGGLAGAQVFVSGEFDPMAGVGVFAGAGGGPTVGNSSGPLRPGLSGSVQGHFEGGAGIFPFGATVSSNASTSGSSSSIAGPAGRFGPAGGAYVGVGPSFGGAAASHQFFCGG